MAWPSALSAGEASPDLRADQRRQALGRLVEDQEARVGHQRAPDRQHLLLAARQLVAEMCRAARRAGEKRIDAVERPARCAETRRRGGDQVFLDREGGEDLRGLPAPGRARLARCGNGGRPMSGRPSKVTLPPVAGNRPMSVRMVVVLPMPLRPSRVDAPRRRRSRSSRRTAPARGRRRRWSCVDGQHRLTPSRRRDRRRRTCGSLRTASGVPVARMRP